MKRFFLLLALSVVVARAEEATLPKNVIMRVEKRLVSVKAGTSVEVVKREAKAITIKWDGRTGTIPPDSFVLPSPEKAVATTTVAASTQAAKPTVVPAAKPSSNPPATGATSTYGKMIEKAQSAVAAHEKANTSDDGLLENRK